MWGSHMPWARANVDQVPLPFVNSQDTTYNEKGAKRVSINAGQDSLTKRQYTAQLAFRPELPPRPADPAAAAVWDTHAHDQPRPALIFRGQGRVPQREKDAYSSEVDVYFQDKAWLDRNLAEQWALETWGAFIKAQEAAGVLPRRSMMLFLDNLDSQKTTEFMGAVNKFGPTELHFCPAGFTDQTQPIDDGYGALVKLYIAQELDDWLDDPANLEKWESDELTAGDRRILMTHWLAAATKKANAKHDSLWRYFERTGALMKVDGSGADKLKLEGKPKEETFDFDSFILEDVMDDGDEPEPEDEVPDREPTEGADMLSDDDEEVDNFEFKLSDGWTISAEADLRDLPAALAAGVGAQSDAADALVGRTIIFNWLSAGWCVGKIESRNTDRSCKVGRDHVNFLVKYEVDGPDAPAAEHVLKLDDLLTSLEQVQSARHNHWVLVNTPAADQAAA
jgi:hypothetical protein